MVVSRVVGGPGPVTTIQDLGLSDVAAQTMSHVLASWPPPVDSDRDPRNPRFVGGVATRYYIHTSTLPAWDKPLSRKFNDLDVMAAWSVAPVMADSGLFDVLHWHPQDRYAMYRDRQTGVTVDLFPPRFSYDEHPDAAGRIEWATIDGHLWPLVDRATMTASLVMDCEKLVHGLVLDPKQLDDMAAMLMVVPDTAVDEALRRHNRGLTVTLARIAKAAASAQEKGLLVKRPYDAVPSPCDECEPRP